MYRLELRSTENWDDVRYRDYTSSEDRMKRFEALPKIQFTDSGHGIVPVVSKCGSRGRDQVNVLETYVRQHGAH